MTSLHTAHLVLRAADTAEATRIVRREPDASDAWADDFPFEGDVIGATMFLRATERSGEQQPFGFYVLSRKSDGKAIGALGFKGQPMDGRVEIGYGLVPSARGHGYAAEAARAATEFAWHQGVRCVAADTDTDNIASQRTLINAGFTETHRTTELVYYEAVQPAERQG